MIDVQTKTENLSVIALFIFLSPIQYINNVCLGSRNDVNTTIAATQT